MLPHDYSCREECKCDVCLGAAASLFVYIREGELGQGEVSGEKAGPLNTPSVLTGTVAYIYIYIYIYIYLGMRQLCLRMRLIRLSILEVS